MQEHETVIYSHSPRNLWSNLNYYNNKYIFLEGFSTLNLILSSSAQNLMLVLIFCGVTLMIFNVIECDNSSAVIGHQVLSPGLLLVHTDHVTWVLASDWLQHTR